MSFSWLPIEVVWSLLAIYALLVFASTAVYALSQRRQDHDFTELRARVRTWWVIVGLFTGALVSHWLIAICFFAVVSALALHEYISLVPTRDSDKRLHLWAYSAIPFQYYWVAIGWYEMFIVFVPVYVFLALPVRAIIGGNTQGYVSALASLHWGLMTTVFSISHTAFLLVFPVGDCPHVAPLWPSEAAAEYPGAGLIVLLVLLTQSNDVAQYLWGKSLGNRKIAPGVSPGKTWAGFLGGVATTACLAAMLGPLLTFLDFWFSFGAGLLISIAGFFGDLAVSAIKRDLGVKDAGHLLPGHGGVLDRVDSLTYSAPLFFHYLYYFYG